MLTAAENDLLCRVEGDAPMGQMMRRHWLPACLLEEVPAPDGDPVPVRLLGEDLVAFRDTDGRVGVMDRYCPHRRASLVFGRNEDWRAALPVPRVEDGRRGQRARDAVGGRRQLPRAEGQASRLSGARMGRLRLGVHGTGGDDARIRAAAVRAGSRREAVDREARDRLQLGAGARRRDRLGAQFVAALDRHDAGTRGQREGDRRPCGCARRPTRHRGSSVEPHRLRLQVRGGAPSHHQRRVRTTTCASRCSSRRSSC